MNKQNEKQKCRVCKAEFFVDKKKVRTVFSRGETFLSPLSYHDAVDCPECGCQVILRERLMEAKAEKEEEK